MRYVPCHVVFRVQDAAERDAAKEKVEQKMEVQINSSLEYIMHPKTWIYIMDPYYHLSWIQRHDLQRLLLWSLQGHSQLFTGEENEEGAEKGPWCGQMQAAVKLCKCTEFQHPELLKVYLTDKETISAKAAPVASSLCHIICLSGCTTTQWGNYQRRGVG